MKMLFRWYGPNDSIPIKYISQIPNVAGVVSAVYDVPVGEVWSIESIKELRDLSAANNLSFEVIESVPVHEDIKIGKSTRDKYIDAYIQNIKNLASFGVKCICYNFMPVFDWLRSDLDFVNADGSTSLIYQNDRVLAMDPGKGDLSLPGWDSSYTKTQMQGLLDDYKNVDDNILWENLKYFLDAIIPVCEECGVNMAIHPDDPPWSIFGLPRIIINEKSLDKFLSLNNSINNGLTLCTGSLGVNPANDIPRLMKKFGSMKRIHFVHARNIKITNENCFAETAHPSDCGSLNMYDILKALYDAGFDGYIRPDHGRMIWGESGKPGYGLYDRALGAAYLSGLWEAIANSK